MIKRKKIDTIPEFKNREEEAGFWDTHSVVDYWDKSKEVKVRVARNLSSGLTVRFDDRTLGRIRTEANNKGIGPTTLIRMWVMEKLRVSA